MNEAQAQQTRIIEGHKRNEFRQQERVAVQLDHKFARNLAVDWQEYSNLARCYLDLEKKIEGLEADTSAGDTDSVRDMEIESLRLRNKELDLQLTNERILRNAAEAERNGACAEKDSRIAELEQSVSRLIDMVEKRQSEIDKLYNQYVAETERCAKIAREYPLSPVVGKAIAALIMEGRYA